MQVWASVGFACAVRVWPFARPVSRGLTARPGAARRRTPRPLRAARPRACPPDVTRGTAAVTPPTQNLFYDWFDICRTYSTDEFLFPFSTFHNIKFYCKWSCLTMFEFQLCPIHTNSAQICFGKYCIAYKREP